MGNPQFDALRQAGFSDEEILADAGFTPEEISAETSSSVFAPSLVGGSKGILKGLSNVLTAPADLLYRGGNAAIEAMGGDKMEDLSYFLPSRIAADSIDALAGDTASNTTAETVGNFAGTVAGIPLAPSALGSASKIMKGAPLLDRAIVGAGAGAAEGAFWNTALAARDANPDYETAMTTGALTGAGVSAGGHLAGELASDAAPVLNRMADRLNESSIGAKIKDFAASRRRGGMVPSEDAGLETRLSRSIREITNEGVLPKLRGATNTRNAVSDAREVVGREIGNIITPIEEAGIRPQLRYTNAERAIEDAPLQLRQGLRQELAAFRDTFEPEWTGGISKLHQSRSTVGQTAYSGPSTGNTPGVISNKMQQALYQDLTDAMNGAVREGADSGVLAPEAVEQLAEANRRYSNYKNVTDIVEDSAIRAQHAPFGQRFVGAMATTGGFGVPALTAAYNDKPLTAAGIVTAGLLTRTRAGAAVGSAIAQKGAQGAQLLSMLGDNPYMLNGLAIKAIPRDWVVVKNDDAAKRTIAEQNGIPPEVYNSLPEPAQQAIHEQTVLANPDGAEPVPGNYPVVNGILKDPTGMHSDYIKRQTLSKSPLERANIMSGLFDGNKFNPEMETLPSAPAQSYTPEIGDINSMLGQFPQTPAQQGASPQLTSMLDQLEYMTRIHAEDDLR